MQNKIQGKKSVAFVCLTAIILASAKTMKKEAALRNSMVKADFDTNFSRQNHSVERDELTENDKELKIVIFATARCAAWSKDVPIAGRPDNRGAIVFEHWKQLPQNQFGNDIR